MDLLHAVSVSRADVMVDWSAAWGRAGIWSTDAGARLRRRFLLPWFGDVPRAAVHIRHWATEACGPGRLMPWLPVLFGLGIVGYFTAAQEPNVVMALAVALGFGAVAVLMRWSPIVFPVALALSTMTAGFTTASLKSFIISHPVLHHVASNVDIAGFVEVRE